MGPRLRGNSSAASVATPSGAQQPPRTLAKRVFKALRKQVPCVASDFVLPFRHQAPLATYFHDLANATAGISDYTLDFTPDEFTAAETHTYMLEMEKDILIDAQYKGNVSRFINHSCAPNCSAQKWTCEGDILRIGIVALAPIARGEEITFDYQLNRDWIDEFGYARKRLFLSHAVPDDVDIDTYFLSTRPTKRQTTPSNWYHRVLTHPPVPCTSFLAGGLLDYSTLLLRESVTTKTMPCSKPRPRRKSLLESRYQLIKDVHEFAEGRSVWNRRLRVTQDQLDVGRIYRFVENIENGVHHQHGETNDLNEDACHRCGTAGELICCDGCPAAFHLSCAGLHRLPPPTVDWYCQTCKRSKNVVSASQRTAQANAIFQVGPAPETKRWLKRKVGRPKKLVVPSGEPVNTSTASPDRVDMA
ncbi:hypothetical protein DYB38_004560 [Aphanomyces astaci]|uniref:PHD-type domain-containing protein n=1 Tax=Aphanomyces astaci TaxID=112090 RepID=A0A397E6W9_APHAT|nr:hypothetical protein DYB38_004560 [Aphanomyces astaci]